MIDKKDIPTIASVGEDNNFYRYDDNTMVFVWRNRGYLAECVVVKYWTSYNVGTDSKEHNLQMFGLISCM